MARNAHAATLRGYVSPHSREVNGKKTIVIREVFAIHY